MAYDKAPDCDGFPYVFYKAPWHWVGPDLYNVYLEAFYSNSLGKLINKGNIKFIPKFGDPLGICNWCPITLHHISYKVIPKSMALQECHLLPLIV